MRRKILISSAIAGVVLLAACRKNTDVSADDPSSSINNCVVQQSTENGRLIADQYIVAYTPTVTSGLTTNSRAATITPTFLRGKGISSTALKRTFNGGPGGFIARLTAAEVTRLKQDPSVSMVEQDRIIAYGSCFQVVEPRLITWNVDRVGYGDGTGKTAWIIDSGIDFTHPDLNADATRSKSFISGVTSASDENGHGTHVAGIIGAKNNSIGMLGVASGASLVALRVFDKDGKGTLGSIIQALAYINENAKAGDVVNMSLGEDEVSSILDQQVKNTASKGIYFAIASGNDSKPAVDFSPGRANAPNIYTVSAVDSLDNYASFSNYGNDVVDFAAPGVRIPSTYLNGKYAILTGTSMAAPHVAGLLLLKGNAITTSGFAKNDPDGTADPIAHK